MKTWLGEDFPPHSGVDTDCFIIDGDLKAALSKWISFLQKHKDSIWNQLTQEQQDDFNEMSRHSPELAARAYGIFPENRSMATFKKMLNKFRIRMRKGDWTWCLCDICATNKQLVNSLKQLFNQQLTAPLTEEEQRELDDALQQQAHAIFRDKKRLGFSIATCPGSCGDSMGSRGHQEQLDNSKHSAEHGLWRIPFHRRQM